MTEQPPRVNQADRRSSGVFRSSDDIRMIEKLGMSWSRTALEQLVLDPGLVRPEGIH